MEFTQSFLWQDCTVIFYLPVRPIPYLDLSQLKSFQKAGLWKSAIIPITFFQATDSRKGCHIAPKESLENYQALLADDIGKWQNKLNQHTGTKPILFSYPSGAYCKESIPILKGMGIQISIGCEEGITNVNTEQSL